MPDEIMGLTQGFFKNQAILFLFFDLSRSETFHENETERVNAKWLLNEANTMNKNNKISMFLIATNADKANDFNKEDAYRFAQEYNMTYIEVNCTKTNDC